MKPYTKSWKNIANHQTPEDILQHCFLKAFFAKETNQTTPRDIVRNQIAKSFTPVTNELKLVNGVAPWQCILKLLGVYATLPLDYLMDRKVLQLEFRDAEKTIFGDRLTQRKFWEFVKQYAKVGFENLGPEGYGVYYDKRYYSYFFVEQKNIPKIHQLIQTGHAAMVIGQNMSADINAEEVFFQVCQVPEGYDTYDYATFLIEQGFPVEVFIETGTTDENVIGIIAFGTHPIRTDKRRFLTNLELLQL